VVLALKGKLQCPVAAIAVGVLIALVLACSQPPAPTAVLPTPTPAPPIATQLPLPSTEPFPGTSWTRDGQPVDTAVISLTAQPEQCGFSNLSLLTVGWPLGRAAVTDKDARQYVRDPGNAFADKTLGKFLPSVTLPEDAVFTGYRYGTDELWVSPETIDTTVYLVRNDVVEQWPRARELFACA
jgi:hypothetical protein